MMHRIKFIILRNIQIIFTICIICVSIITSTGLNFADGLSPTEIQNLETNPNWVGSECATGLSNLSNGTGLSDGAQFPNLDPTAMGNAINTWITSTYPSSPFRTLGSNIVKDAKTQNINPFLIVSLAAKESGLGTTTVSDSSWVLANNAFGRRPGGDQPNISGWYHWTNFKDSIDPSQSTQPGGGDMASYLNNVYGTRLESNNILAMMESYDPPVGNGQNTIDYVQFIQTTVNSLIALTTGENSSPTNSSATDPSITQTSNSNNNGSSCMDVNYNCPSTATATSGDNKLSSVRQSVVCIARGELSLWSAQSGYPWADLATNPYAEKGYLKYSENRVEYWCADFATWVYNQAGDPVSGSTKSWDLPAVIEIVDTAENSDNFSYHDSSSGYTPKPGDLSIYDFGTGNGYDHVDIVVSVSGSTVETIGGDTGTNINKYPGGSIVGIGTKSGFYSQGVIGYVSPNQ